MTKRIFKFGGSSVRDAQAYLRSSDLIVEAGDQLAAVVVSATYNTTNLLEFIFQELQKKQPDVAIAKFHQLNEHHAKILDELARHLEIELSLSERVEFLRVGEEAYLPLLEQAPVDLALLDHLYSYGEMVSSRLMHWLLKKRSPEVPWRWIDARELIETDAHHGQANPKLDLMDQKQSYWRMELSHQKIITQGFIGRGPRGESTTLGREGSDFSATLLARLLGLDEVTIWTDVPGVASFDPKLVPGPRFISRMSYEEAEALAEAGAKILFPRTLAPVKDQQILVRVRSSYDGVLEGTWIGPQKEYCLTGFAMALKNLSDKLALLTIIGISVDQVKELQQLVPELLELDHGPQKTLITLPRSITLDCAQRIHAHLLSSAS